MKPTMLLLALVQCAGMATGQERIPDEEARTIAAILGPAASKAKPPLKVEPDVNHPYGKRKDDYAALVLPVKGLAKAIAAAREELVPVGQLWLKGLSPIVDNQPASAKKLLIVAVTHNDRDINLVLCSLAVQLVKDRHSLVILGKDRKPLAVLPLETVDEKQEKPIEFTVSIEGDEGATLKLTFQGKYQTRLKVGVLTD